MLNNTPCSNFWSTPTSGNTGESTSGRDSRWGSTRWWFSVLL